MRNFKKSRLALVAALAIGLLMTGILELPPVYAAGKSFTIGISAPLSGISAQRGKYIKDAAEFAKEEINSKGGVNGIKFELAYEDNEGNPTKVVNTVTKLIEQKRVDALIVSDSSGTMAAIPVVTKMKIPMFMTAFSPGLTQQGSAYVFRATVSDQITAAKVVEYAVKEMGLKKVAIMASDDSYGQGGAEAAAQALEKMGNPAVINEKFNRKDQDFSAPLLNIKKSGADVVFVHTYNAPAAMVTKQLNELGIKIQVIGATALASEQYRDLAGANIVEGVTAFVAFINSNPDSMIQDFVKNFEKTVGYLPDHNSARAHAAIHLYAKAVAQAGSTQKEAITKALHSFKDVKLPGGTYSFDETGEGLKQVMAGQWKNGTLEFIKEFK